MWNPAIIYSALAFFAASVQVVLLFGAPLGKLTLAGRWPGVLPPWVRAVAALQALLLIGMSIAMLERAGLSSYQWPDWSYLVAITLTALSLLGNSISPSLPEWRLWTPVLAIMLLCGFLA